ncbi:AAC(3) family N-acetyltransferase [Candidatus Babeliales bacterium]|nr:AAC(3) family N-acetyltransferase [Candidatus Babeliales bacterium]
MNYQAEYDYSKDDIIKSLKSVGLKNGDSVFSHSNIGFFGRLARAKDKYDYYKIFKEAIFDIISSDGTFVVPTFSYSFCKKEIYDIKNTPSTCGFLSEMVRVDKDSLRSLDANFSVAAIGKNSKFFTENAPEHSFGLDSFWEKFLNLNGKICNFNFDAGSTFFHYFEKKLGVDYRFDKAFSGKTILENGEHVKGTFYHFCRDLNKQDNYPDNTKFDKTARAENLVKCANLGRGQIVLISAKDSYNLISQEIKINPNFLIMDEKLKEL